MGLKGGPFESTFLGSKRQNNGEEWMLAMRFSSPNPPEGEDPALSRGAMG